MDATRARIDALLEAVKAARAQNAANLRQSRIAITVMAVCVVPLAVLLDGTALATLWGWFVAPIFGGPSLTIAQAIGIATVATFLTKRWRYEPPAKDQAEEMKRVIASASYLIGKPIAYLAFGWVVSCWV